MFSGIHRRLSTRAGFTLVELLVVVAIIGVLVSLLLPAIQSAREAARRTSCINNLKQLGIAAHNFHDSRRKLPPSGLVGSSTAGTYDGQSGVMFSWAVLLLPYLEEQNLYDRFNQATSILSQTGEPQETPVAAYQCPSDSAGDRVFKHPTLTNNKKFAKGNYVAYVSPFHAEFQNYFPGAIIQRAQSMLHVQDGTSKTVMFSEVLTRNDEQDLRGAWALPWCGSSQLAFDAHDLNWHESDLKNGVKPTPFAWNGAISAGKTQLPNNLGPSVDAIYECPNPAGAKAEKLPCATMGPLSPTVFYSAAPRSNHPGGVNATHVDGHVDFLTNEINEIFMAYLISINDGQRVNNSH